MSDMKFNFTQKMQQQLKLSPQMIQSVELLRLPIEELCDRVYQEAEKNPAIEIVKDAERFEPAVKNMRSSKASDVFQSLIENTASHEESLQEHLLAQISLFDIDANKRNLSERIIQSLDSHGYFSTQPESLLYPNETIENLSEALSFVRSLDPKGIGFSSVQESLLFQSKSRDNCSILAREILQNHFSLLEKKRIPLITKYLNELGLECSLEEVSEALDCIKSLDPYPARQFMSVDSTVQYVVPDAIVRKVEDDDEENAHHGFVIEFLKESLPQITLSPVYTDLLEEKKGTKENNQFVSDAVQSAKQFINALAFRTDSIYNVIKEIVEIQHSFFSNGPGFLVPLRQKDVAEKIGVHEATISRIANGKYVQCDWGLFEIKYFFTNAIQTTVVQDVKIPTDSKESVKHQILLLLQENENNGGKKLSDAKLAQKLEEKGIVIARRTVAKYRNELNIESSFDRL